MKNLVPSLVLAALLGAPLAANPEPDPKRLHVVLLAGQSNMAGRAKLQKGDDKPIERAWLWNVKEKKWEPAKAPFNRHAPHSKGLAMQRLNPGPSFAKAYLEKHPDAELGIVCVARGGTSIEQWEKGLEKPWPLYDSGVAAAKEALSGGGRLVAVCWHQGESNSGRADGYPPLLAQLAKNFRADLGEPAVPFVFGQIGSWRKEYKAFNEMIVEQSKAIPNSACVLSEGLGNMDNAHFDRDGQIELGKRYAEALATLKVKALARPAKEGFFERARRKRTEADVRVIDTALLLFYARNARYPTTEEGLQALVEKPKGTNLPNWVTCLKEVPTDWAGTPYQYVFPAKRSRKAFDLFSAGKDKTPGTDDDIGNWSAEPR